MLPKSKRLNLKKDFNWVVSGAKGPSRAGKMENSLVKLFFRFGENETAKVGIALSKTVFKKAVERNRARRIVSKGFENLYDKLPEGINIIAFPKEAVLKISSEEFTKALEEILKKEGVINF